MVRIDVKTVYDKNLNGRIINDFLIEFKRFIATNINLSKS